MTVASRLSSRARRRCRAAGATLAAAAVLPWLAVLPVAQAGVLSSASNDEIVSLCHATDSDASPYVYLELSAADVISEHLAHRNSPTQTWHSDTLFMGNLHPAGSPKPDIISDFSGYTLDGIVNPEDCGNAPTSSTTRTRTRTSTTTTTTSTTTVPTTSTSTTTTSTTTVPTTSTSTTTTSTTTVPTTSTSTTTTSTTTVPTTSTTTVPTTSTSSTTSPTDTATVLPTKATSSPGSSDGAQVSAESDALPRTGTDAGRAALLSLLLLGTGGFLLRVSGMRLQRPRKH